MAKEKGESLKVYRARQLKLDRRRRELYLTDAEWAEVKVFIGELRKACNKSPVG